MFLLAGLPAKPASAGAYVFPTQLGISQISFRLFSWEENNNDLNPCYQYPSCYLGPDVMYREHAPSMFSTCQQGHCMRIEGYRTRKEVMEAWRLEKGIPLAGAFAIENRNMTCIGMFYINEPKPPGPGNYTAQRFPGSLCGELPPINQTCHVNIPQPEIDFGTLNFNQINGSTRQIAGQVYCTLPGSIILRGESMLGEKRIYFDGARRQFYSTLSINEQEAASGVHFTLPGSNIWETFRLQATLQADSPPDAGQYTGNGIVYISYP